MPSSRVRSVTPLEISAWMPIAARNSARPPSARDQHHQDALPRQRRAADVVDTAHRRHRQLRIDLRHHAAHDRFVHRAVVAPAGRSTRSRTIRGWSAARRRETARTARRSRAAHRSDRSSGNRRAAARCRRRRRPRASCRSRRCTAPTGSRSLKYRFANASLMIATGAAVLVSLSRNVRPPSSGRRSVSK